VTKNEQQQQEDKKKYRGADKSLARPGKKQARNHVKDARNFNIIYWPGWPVPEAAITAVRAPNDGCQQPKHVELLTKIKKKKNWVSRILLDNYEIWFTMHGPMDIKPTLSMTTDTTELFL